ncbi:MAG: hypothetical protein KIT17_27460 [Rubrivivax sp.]|nr:hypothetical protein [Rubrivivax sp.]
MTWLSENWWLVLISGGLLLFMLRGRGMMGCGMGGHGAHDRSGRGMQAADASPEATPTDAARREEVPGGSSAAQAPGSPPSLPRADPQAKSRKRCC